MTETNGFWYAVGICDLGFICCGVQSVECAGVRLIVARVTTLIYVILADGTGRRIIRTLEDNPVSK